MNPEIDVILLDEPDAHLHPSLQLSMISELTRISSVSKKQILIATHSSEIIKSLEPTSILSIGSMLKYLSKSYSFNASPSIENEKKGFPLLIVWDSNQYYLMACFI